MLCNNRSRHPAELDRFWSRVNKNGPIPSNRPDLGPCWIWTGLVLESGYGQFYSTATTKKHRAHRYAWGLTDVPIPDDGLICHVCDTKLCMRNDTIGTYEVDGIVYVRRGHLWLGDEVSNMTDMALKGRAAKGLRSGKYTKPESTLRGAKHPGTRLTDEMVLEMRTRWLNREISAPALAKELGMSHSGAYGMLSGASWKHLNNHHAMTRRLYTSKIRRTEG